MEKNAELTTIYKNIQNITSSSFKNMATETLSAFKVLNANIKSMTEELGIVWEDNVSTEIIESEDLINKMIEAASLPLVDIVPLTGNAVDELNEAISTYNKLVDEYNSLEVKCNERENALGSQPSRKDDMSDEMYLNLLSDWRNKKQEVNNLKGAMDTKKNEIDTWENQALALVTKLKGLLSEIGSENSNSAISSVSFSSPKTYEGEPATEFGYGDGYTVSGTVLKDSNGNKISETYTVTDALGNVVRSGLITYNSEGLPNREEYVIEEPEPTVISQAKVEAVNKGLPSVAAYLDDDTKAEKETHDIRTDYSKSEDGDTNYTKTDNYRESFQDGALIEGTERVEGSVLETTDDAGQSSKILLPKHAEDDFTLVTPEGEVFEGHSDTTFVDGREKFKELTLSQDDEVVLTQQDENIAEYEDRTLGYDVSTTQTKVDTEGNTTTVRTTGYFTDSNGVAFEEEVIIVRDNNDPQCGYVQMANGEKYEYTRDANGALVETYTSTDKNGNEQTQSSIVETEEAVLTTTNCVTGETTNETINLGSKLDTTMLEFDYQNARMEVGYKAEASYDGIHHLYSGGSVDIQGVFDSDPQYTMSLTFTNGN